MTRSQWDWASRARWLLLSEKRMESSTRQRDVPTDEPLWWLRSVQISTYYSTVHWRLLRKRFLAEVEHECALCGMRTLDLVAQEEAVGVCWEPEQFVVPDSPLADELWTRPLVVTREREPSWTVHHRTYERLGEEELDDLCLLCSPCHQLVHRPHTSQAKHWLAHNNDPTLADRAAALCPSESPWSADRDGEAT